MNAKSMFRLFSAFAAVGMCHQAVADCNDPLLDGSNLSGKLVCAYRSDGLTNASNRWSEIHNATSGSAVTLGEHGRGTTDPAGSYDPNVGQWSFDTSNITYTYTDDSGSPYTWALRGTTGPDQPNAFCQGSTQIATIFAIVELGSVSDADSNPCGW